MDIYARRRERFLEAIGDAVAVIPGGTERTRSHDVHYPFRQDSYFQYLTGFPEPDAWAILSRSGDESRFKLVVRPRDKERETWDGRRAGTDGAKSRYGADEAYPTTDLPQVIESALAQSPTVYFQVGADPGNDILFHQSVRQLKRKARQGIHPPVNIVSPASILDEMRLIKNEDDLGPVREAARIAVEAHAEVVRIARVGIAEYEIQAIVEYVFRALGASGPAYPSIVGCGENATILHYHENNCQTRADDLVLIDAGAEVACYGSDITRTFPISGTCTPEQSAIYELVLQAQNAAIDAARPGRAFESVHRASLEVLAEGLSRLRILEGTPESILESESYKRFFMHQTSHWLGMDVHDVGRYKIEGASRTLQAGMILTVEPGLYFPNEDGVPEQYRGIGVRIEDDVLITKTGNETLTAEMPRTLAALADLREETPRFLQRQVA